MVLNDGGFLRWWVRVTCVWARWKSSREGELFFLAKLRMAAGMTLTHRPSSNSIALVIFEIPMFEIPFLLSIQHQQATASILVSRISQNRAGCVGQTNWIDGCWNWLSKRVFSYQPLFLNERISTIQSYWERNQEPAHYSRYPLIDSSAHLTKGLTSL